MLSIKIYILNKKIFNIMNYVEEAVQLFEDGYMCSQAVLAVFCEEFGLSREQAFKISISFGGGMRKGEVCGACTGALMALGLLYGQSHIGDQDERQRSNGINDLMMERFQEANGSYICNDLLGYDISTPEGAQRAREDGLFVDLCPKMVASAVDILERIIKELKE